MKKIAWYMCVLLAVGCQRSTLQDPSNEQQGRTMEVPLSLSFAPVNAVSRSFQGTVQWNEGAVSGEVSIGAIEEGASRAVDETTVANVWVLQFEGTATSSRLLYKSYLPNYTAGDLITILSAKEEGRVAVVANTFDAAWGDPFVVGTATWASVSASTRGVIVQADVVVGSSGTEYVPMSGSFTGQITAGTSVVVPLSRTVAKLTVGIKSGINLNASAFDVQLCNVPNTTGWFPDSGSEVWPVSPTVVSYPSEHMAGITTTDYKTLTYWVPVNRRGTVAGTTGLSRAQNAPASATYLKVVGDNITYTIHLGADFLTDYNLNANTAYTYRLTTHTDRMGADSRVRWFDVMAPGLVGKEGATAYISVRGTVGLNYKVTKKSGDGQINLVAEPTVGTIPEGGVARVPVLVEQSVGAAAARSAVFTVSCTTEGTSFEAIDLTVRQEEGEPFVVINGLKWATGNLVASNPTAGPYDLGGCKIGAPSDGGLFFQFGSLIGYKGGNQDNGGTGVGLPQAPLSGTNQVYFFDGSRVYSWDSEAMVWPTSMRNTKTTWTDKSEEHVETLEDYYFNYSMSPWETKGSNIRDFAVPITGDTGSGSLGAGRYAPLGVGDPCSYYLGGSWRLPTTDECAALCKNLGGINVEYSLEQVGGSWSSSLVGGYLSGTSLFFLGTGVRHYENGAFWAVSYGSYSWTSTVYDAFKGLCMEVGYDRVFPQGKDARANGYVVRCVSE